VVLSEFGMLNLLPPPRRILARLIGFGLRREHVTVPTVPVRKSSPAVLDYSWRSGTHRCS
jgi:hypothetical protein